MKVINWKEFLEGSIKNQSPAAVSIGVFDGVHAGHRDLLSKIVNRKNSKSVVVTFRDNPKKYFSKNNYLGDLSTLSQKLSLFSSLGIDTVILIDFSCNFSSISGRDFLYSIRNSCDLSYLILGNNFRCGHKGMTTSVDALKILKEEKITIEIGNMTRVDDDMISSTIIRKAVVTGNLSTARKMLKRVYSLDIADIPQISGEETIIINKKHISQVLPPQGQYPVLAGTSDYTLETNIIIDGTEITVPVMETERLNFLNFKDE